MSESLFGRVSGSALKALRCAALIAVVAVIAVSASVSESSAQYGTLKQGIDRKSVV